MSGATGEALWTIFVEDGRLRARRLADPKDPDEAAHDAYAIAISSLLMGIEETGRLALAMERAFAALAGKRTPAQKMPLPPVAELRAALGEPLARGADLLATAFEALANPDMSGARVDAQPLAAARQAIEAALGDVVSGMLPPASIPVVSAAASTPPTSASPPDDELKSWVPTVEEDMIDLFIDEAGERLEALSQKLLQLEARPSDGELVRDIFRDLHTVKGSSAMVGLRAMNRLAHAAEDLVGQVRDGARTGEKAVVDALLAATDGLRAILACAVKRQPIDVDLAPLVARVRNPGAPAAHAPAFAESAATSTPSLGASKHDGQKQTLRVDFDKLDLLLNLVGELVLSKAGLTTGIQGLASLGRELESERRLARRVTVGRTALQHAKRQHQLTEELGRVERVFQELAHDLDAASGRVDRVSAELRDQVMKLRMLPIAGVFRKHHRTVRDLAHALGKRVRLELVGEDTELDKILVEQLEDPLMHLVRNAVDHGIEAPGARSNAGKDPEGVLRLSAYHRGNQIVLEISDDGGGMDPARLRAKAREKKIASDEELADLDDEQVLELIFRPGFSTAAKVSEVSGRGVGMDVVRDAIVSKLKGTVDVSSKVGAGTTFTLRLPLTLAIIHVLLARAGGEVFCIPLDVVARTLTCSPSDVRVLYDREVLPVHDRDGVEGHVPLIRLKSVLELDTREDMSEAELHVILVDVFGSRFGLVCERLLGKQEIVIKSLGDLLEEVPCAAGATLIGDRCALILDVAALVARAIQLGRPHAQTAATGEPAQAAPHAESSSRPRVLLVEDSDTIRAGLKRLLEGAGAHVTEARDGAEGLALALAAQPPFELVSTDVMMPNMDGYELTRALRASPAYRDTPIIMVTSRGEKIDRVRGFDAGVDEYITKPHDRQELLRAVHKHLPAAGRPA